MSRRDDVSSFYKYSVKISKTNNYLLIINVILAFLTMILKETLNEIILLKEIIIVIQIVIAFSYVVMNVIDDYLFWFNAESYRRKSSIENAFNVNFTGLRTEDYYNNTINPSINKYIVNTFENIFFSKNISEKMFKKVFFKAFLVVIVFIISCIEIENGEVLLLIAQTIFSSNYLAHGIALAFYYVRLNKLYDIFYTQLISVGVTSENQIILLVSSVVEYESIKSHYKIRLSSKIFKKFNPKLSMKWKDISDKIIIKN